ncbi:MAG TPA: hypothetical protein DCY74_05620, partial [Clostridiales bacterium]|nr:hypothetical protein [Clostridiales bacterium]
NNEKYGRSVEYTLDKNTLFAVSDENGIYVTLVTAFDLLYESTLQGFDFSLVWKMGESGPVFKWE